MAFPISWPHAISQRWAWYFSAQSGPCPCFLLWTPVSPYWATLGSSYGCLGGQGFGPRFQFKFVHRIPGFENGHLNADWTQAFAEVGGSHDLFYIQSIKIIWFTSEDALSWPTWRFLPQCRLSGHLYCSIFKNCSAWSRLLISWLFLMTNITTGFLDYTVRTFLPFHNTPWFSLPESAFKTRPRPCVCAILGVFVTFKASVLLDRTVPESLLFFNHFQSVEVGNLLWDVIYNRPAVYV